MPDKPRRIQRKRTKGWKMPPNTVYVGRPTRWGNPYIPLDSSPAELQGCIAEYRKHIHKQHGEWWFDINESNRLSSLRGKNLACWCPLDKPCHADVLLEIANERKS